MQLQLCDTERMVVSGPEMLTQSVHLDEMSNVSGTLAIVANGNCINTHGDITPCNIVPSNWLQ